MDYDMYSMSASMMQVSEKTQMNNRVVDNVKSRSKWIEEQANVEMKKH